MLETLRMIWNRFVTKRPEVSKVVQERYRVQYHVGVDGPPEKFVFFGETIGPGRSARSPGYHELSFFFTSKFPNISIENMKVRVTHSPL